MAIPTKEEFDAWLSLAAMPIEVGASLPPEPTELTVDDAANYLRQADADRETRWRTMCGLSAWQWLDGQREFQRAYERVFGSRRPRKRDRIEPCIDRYQARAQQYFDIAEELHVSRLSNGWQVRASERARGDHLRQSIERAGRVAFKESWRTNTMRAVAEYLEGEAAARILNAAAEIEEAANTAQEAVTRYMRLSGIINGAGFLSFRAHGPRTRPGGAFHFGPPDPATLPIGGRKDARSDERLFVYRMFVANRVAVRSQKVEAIAELMGLEGFRHQYETRTIERLCARFAEMLKRSRATKPL